MAHGAEKTPNDPSELVAVEAQFRRTGPAKLVHPVGWGGRFFLPPHGRTKDEIDIPRRHSIGQTDDSGIQFPQSGIGIVEAQHALVGNASSFTTGCRFHRTPSKHRQPDDVGPEVLAGNLRENSLFNLGGPPKTNASGRIEQEEQTDLTRILVELLPERVQTARAVR